ncbi:MAG: phosphoribosylanthranilate isomerase [Actinomycetota bacterium]
MKVQIYGTRTLDDARALAGMGVDHLGLELEHGGDELARVERIIETVRGQVTTVLLPLLDSRDAMVAAVERLRPEVVHISANVDVVGLDQIESFRDAVSPTKVMKAIPVAPPAYSHTVDSLGYATAFDPFVDYLLLDTKLGDEGGDPLPGWIGITGKTHDWTVSRSIGEACRTPIILAGGLNPGNVQHAIEAVSPWGVDACTGLDLRRGKKDLAKCRLFIDRARSSPER